MDEREAIKKAKAIVNEWSKILTDSKVGYNDLTQLEVLIVRELRTDLRRSRRLSQSEITNREGYGD